MNKALDHDDAIKWKHFPRYWPFVRGIHRSPHILGSLMGLTNLVFKWRNLKHFSYLCDCHSISLHDYNERVFGIDKHWLFSNNSISYYDTRVDFSEV